MYLEIAQAAIAAYKYYQEQEKAANEAKERERFLRLILDAINSAKQEIIQEMHNLRIDELQGVLNGALQNFDTYLRTEPRSETLLVNQVIGPAGYLDGELRAHLSNATEKPDFAIDLFPIYMGIVPLEIGAITEWRFAFNKKTSVAHIKEQAEEQAINIKNVLRKKSDAQFRKPYFGSCIEGCIYGEEIWFYFFNEQKIKVYKGPGKPSPLDVWQKHKNSAYLEYPLVKETFEFIDMLGAARALLEYSEAEEAAYFNDLTTSPSIGNKDIEIDNHLLFDIPVQINDFGHYSKTKE